MKQQYQIIVSRKNATKFVICKKDKLIELLEILEYYKRLSPTTKYEIERVLKD